MRHITIYEEVHSRELFDNRESEGDIVVDESLVMLYILFSSHKPNITRKQILQQKVKISLKNVMVVL